MRKPYFFRVLGQAAKMTKEDIGWASPKAAILHIVLALITLFLIYRFSGLDSFLEEFGLWVITIVGIILWAILLFLWNFAFAPAQLQREADDKIIELELEIYNRKKRQEAIDKLWELRSRGISLRNEAFKSPLNFILTEDWVNSYKSWRDEVLYASEKISKNLKQWLERLDIMRPNSVGLSPHKEVQVMSEILARLAEFLEGEIYNVPRKIPKS